MGASHCGFFFSFIDRWSSPLTGCADRVSGCRYPYSDHGPHTAEAQVVHPVPGSRDLDVGSCATGFGPGNMAPAALHARVHWEPFQDAGKATHRVI